MSLSRFGVDVCCENCHCLAMDDSGGFDIAVPITVQGAGHGGLARLHCCVSAEQHHVEFVDWQGDALERPELSEAEGRQIVSVLDYLAEKRVCGNNHVCPSEVVRIVAQMEKA